MQEKDCGPRVRMYVLCVCVCVCVQVVWVCVCVCVSCSAQRLGAKPASSKEVAGPALRHLPVRVSLSPVLAAVGGLLGDQTQTRGTGDQID